MKRLSALILFLALSSPFLVAQAEEQQRAAEKTVAAWYRSNSRAGTYEPVKAGLEAVFFSARQAQITDELLLEPLNEAAARGIPPAQALAALQARLEELVLLKALLDRFQSCLAAADDQDTPPERLRKLSLLPRRGITLGAIEAVLGEACSRKRDFTAALDALRTIANIPSLGELPEANITALGKAILGSALAPSSYTALSSFYIKGKLKNLGAREITDIIIKVLGEGNGLIRIENELNRRGGQ